MITAPYRFVPLNKTVVIPNFEPVSHDKPYKDGEDGIIVVKCCNETPMFIRNGEGILDTNKYLYPEHVVINGQKQYFIPSTSWQGMIRSVMEIMTFAHLSDDQYNNRTYSERDIANKKCINDKIGWLYLDSDNHYRLMPGGEIDTIKIDEIKSIKENEIGKKYADNKDIIGKLEAYGMNYPIIREKNRTLVFTGDIARKGHEYLFPIFKANATDLIVTEQLVRDFFETYKDSPYNNENDKKHPNFIKSWLEAEKALPVFYKTNNQHIERIGLTKVQRILKPFSITHGVHNGQTECTGLDFVQRIMGYVNGDDALKGRVQFSHSQIGMISDNQLIPAEGILGEPKASYYPLYIANQKNYDDPDFIIAGRKRYVIHENGYQVGFPPTDQLSDNTDVRTKMLLLPTNLNIELRIRFHNLLPEELGAILSALTFHNTHGLYHSIGMAKAYGYGKLRVDSVELRGTTKTDIAHYMMQFEKLMKQSLKADWINSEQMIELAKYATPQSNGLEVMELSEFSKQKKASIAPLKNNIRIKALFTESARIKEIAEQLWTTYYNLQETSYRDRIDVLQNILNTRGIDDSNREKAENELTSLTLTYDKVSSELFDKYQELKARKEYSDALTILREWWTLTGESIAQHEEELRLLLQDAERLSKPLAEQLTLSSAGAFEGSLKKIRKAQEGAEFTDEQLTEIKKCLIEHAAEITKWKDIKKKIKDIEKHLGKELTNELFNR